MVVGRPIDEGDVFPSIHVPHPLPLLGLGVDKSTVEIARAPHRLLDRRLPARAVQLRLAEVIGDVRMDLPVGCVLLCDDLERRFHP